MREYHALRSALHLSRRILLRIGTSPHEHIEQDLHIVFVRVKLRLSGHPYWLFDYIAWRRHQHSFVAKKQYCPESASAALQRAGWQPSFVHSRSQNIKIGGRWLSKFITTCTWTHSRRRPSSDHVTERQMKRMLSDAKLEEHLYLLLIQWEDSVSCDLTNPYFFFIAREEHNNKAWTTPLLIKCLARIETKFQLLPLLRRIICVKEFRTSAFHKTKQVVM